MLRLITGRAGTGKTAAVISEIQKSVLEKKGGNILIVPEQYSHEAERELCENCGDVMSLYAEVLSFTGFARSLMAQYGGGAVKWLDAAGRMLCISLAAANVAPSLKLYSAAARSAELRTSLLSALAELKNACVGHLELHTAALDARESDPGLALKLEDLAVLLGAYDAVLENGSADPNDRLSRLADIIGENKIGKGLNIYIDGFTDFTAAQLRLIKSLLSQGVDISLCLTLDSLSGGDEVFSSSRKTALYLKSFAEENGIAVEQLCCGSEKQEKDGAIEFFADNMFSFSNKKYEGASDAIKLVRLPTVAAECEYAAAQCLRLVRDEGCRWRDIAIAVRGFDAYEPSLMNCFEHYNVPLFSARRSSVTEKPLPMLISCVYALIEDGWDTDTLISYLGTGLTGLDKQTADELAAYVYRWQLRAPAWKNGKDWKQHPEGYGMEWTPEALARLEQVNEAKKRIAAPVLKLEKRAKAATTAAEQARALSAFLDDIDLAERLYERTAELANAGEEALADEYSQLHALIVGALEQCVAVLGDTETDMHEFAQLFVTMLSQYELAVIPVALDRVCAGDFDRMRRRKIKHLIVLGASDSNLPKSGGNTGIFTDDDRERMLGLTHGIDIGGVGEEELWREFTLIYNTLTLPSDSLTLCCPLVGSEGSEARPSVVFSSAQGLFDIKPVTVQLSDVRISAKAPALSLAAHAANSPTKENLAAAEYFRQHEPERLEAVEEAASVKREKLSKEAVEKIYGTRIKLSASKIDTYSECAYMYFCRYGLDAKKYETLVYKLTDIGTFVHEVLEKTAARVKELGGWKMVDDETLETIAREYIAEYTEREMGGFEEKTSRFRHLFERMSREVVQIVRDMAHELRKSKFEPAFFEFNFMKERESGRILNPVTAGLEGADMILTGVADRIDTWEHGGKTYVRVVDYKTGKTRFDMNNVYNGTGLQMLLYLYSLKRNEASAFGKPTEVVPAGVMYVPARDRLLGTEEKLGSHSTDDEIQKVRLKKLRRTGLVLKEPELMEAWEASDEKGNTIFMPKHGSSNDKNPWLASGKQFELIFNHIMALLNGMANELHSGELKAQPLSTACGYCDYAAICRFNDGENGEFCRDKLKLKQDKVWEVLREEAEGKEEAENG